MFRLLIPLLAIADIRRRERHCVGGCRHDWHQLARRSQARQAAATWSAFGRRNADWAGHPGPTDPAVPVRVFGV
ncbi:DUF5958 family protein [Streptomyces hirsutus]|uniref:DUF5958 family protein n=1 Tax=Streptomyces hirsutus TaxID=35620 RepID=UPI0036B742BE